MSEDVLKKWITTGGRELSQGKLKFAFLSESGRRHIVFLCGHDNPQDVVCFSRTKKRKSLPEVRKQSRPMREALTQS